jgi:hypothetical protein
MLAAKNSAVMTEENDHGRVARPQRPETHLLAITVRKNDVGKPAA